MHYVKKEDAHFYNHETERKQSASTGISEDSNPRLIVTNQDLLSGAFPLLELCDFLISLDAVYPFQHQNALP